MTEFWLFFWPALVAILFVAFILFLPWFSRWDGKRWWDP